MSVSYLLLIGFLAIQYTFGEYQSVAVPWKCLLFTLQMELVVAMAICEMKGFFTLFCFRRVFQSLLLVGSAKLALR